MFTPPTAPVSFKEPIPKASAPALRANMRADQPFICGPHPLTYGAFCEGPHSLPPR